MSAVFFTKKGPVKEKRRTSGRWNHCLLQFDFLERDRGIITKEEGVKWKAAKTPPFPKRSLPSFFFFIWSPVISVLSYFYPLTTTGKAPTATRYSSWRPRPPTPTGHHTMRTHLYRRTRRSRRRPRRPLCSESRAHHRRLRGGA